MHIPLPRSGCALAHLTRLAAAGLLALGLALPAASQGPGFASPAPSANASRPLGDEAREWVEDLAQAHLAAIATGRIALDKAQHAQVSSFAQQMIDEHTLALQELQQLGQAKQMSLPRDVDFQHKAIASALRLLTGQTFDRQYIRQAGIKDHRRSVDLLQQVQAGADPELKALAGRQLPVMQRHLARAREIDRALQ
jgi:putative membrane protein